jgi:Zn-dependent protease with chaperone function
MGPLRPFFSYLESETVSRQKKIHFFFNIFFNLDQNQWINKDPYFIKIFKLFFDHLDYQSINFLYHHPQLILIPIKGTLSCTISASSRYHMIVIFPELMELLKSSAYTQALAIMAHELGHIFHGHTQKKMMTIDAQKQADLYAFNQGYGDELIQVLTEFQHLEECRTRIDSLKLLRK